MLWRTKVRLSASTVLVGAFLAANAGDIAVAEETVPIVQLQANHAAMSDAEAAARRHFDRFLTHVLQDDGTARSDAAVKIAIPTGSGHVEVIWITPFATLGQASFLGVLDNAPRSIPNATEGDAIRFTRDQVRDWSFVGPDAKLYGSYTTRVLLPHLEQAQAAQIAAILSDVPRPRDW